MSYTTLYKVTAEGDVEEVEDFRNAFRGAWMVWEQMCKRYLKQDAIFLMGSPDKMQAVWDLWKDTDVPLDHRIVLMSTLTRLWYASRIYLHWFRLLGSMQRDLTQDICYCKFPI